MARNYGDEPVVKPFIAALILAIIFALILLVQHVFNNELAVLYQETGELTKLNFSYVSSVIYLSIYLLLAILMYTGLRDDTNDPLMVAIIFFVAILIPVVICCDSASIYGLHHSPNVRVRVLLAAPVSTLLSTPIFLAFSAMLSRRYGDEPRAFPFILWFPLLSIVVGYFGTFALSFVPDYLVFLNIYCISSIVLTIGAIIFLVISHPIGEIVGFTIEFAENYHSYSSSGGGDSYSSNSSDSSEDETVSDFILDDIARNIRMDARPSLAKASIEGVSVRQSGSNLNITVYLSFSFDSSYDESDVNHIIERESDEIAGRAAGVARERLHYHDIYYIDDINVGTSSDYSYYG